MFFFKQLLHFFITFWFFFSKIPRNLVEERKEKNRKDFRSFLYDDNKMQWSEGMEKKEKKEEKKGGKGFFLGILFFFFEMLFTLTMGRSERQCASRDRKRKWFYREVQRDLQHNGNKIKKR